MFHKSLKALFTGDHVIMTESGLSILEQYNHGSGKDSSVECLWVNVFEYSFKNVERLI